MSKLLPLHELHAKAGAACAEQTGWQVPQHYGDQAAWQAFHPLIGLIYTGRSLIDNLALGVVGISGLHCPRALVPVGLLALVGVLAWWWRPVAERRFTWASCKILENCDSFRRDVPPPHLFLRPEV